MTELVGQLRDNLNSLRPVAVFHQCLKDAASIMFEAQLRVFVSDRLNAFVDEDMLLSVSHFSLLNQKLVVVDSQLLDQI